MTPEQIAELPKLCERLRGDTYIRPTGEVVRDRHEAAAAIEALLAEKAWQDIATAPRDGTPILLVLACKPENFVAVGWWDGVIWRIAPTGYWSNVTHWQPLPALPERGEHLKGDGR
jgi:hypothetical protein